MTVNTSTSYRKGQFNLTCKGLGVERLNFVFHANTLVPLRDTLHFGIKPGHFMLYVKREGQEGKWLVKDAGYVNYFRADQNQIVQTEYNTLHKQKLLSRGFLKVKKVNESKYVLSSFSLLPLHLRVATLDLLNCNLVIKDRYIGKPSLFFNTDTELIEDKNSFRNLRTFSW